MSSRPDPIVYERATSENTAVVVLVAITAILFVLFLGFFALGAAGYLGGTKPTQYIEYTQSCPSAYVLKPDCQCKRDGWLGRKPVLLITCSNPRP